jgi:hypothetical protein
VIPSADDIDDGSLVLHIGILLSSLLRDERPDLIQIDSRRVVLILSDVEVAHADLKQENVSHLLKINK